MPRPADRRAKIELLRAAEAVFVERGLSAAKVEDITARAGVSKGAFYLHFESKDDCWRQIVEGFVAKLAACTASPPPGLEAETIESIAEHLVTWHAHDLEIFEFCWQNRALMGMVFGGGGGTPYAYLMDEFAERLAGQIEGWARRLVAAGVYRPDVDPAVLPALISGGYERLAREMIKQPRRPDIEAWCEQAQRLFTHGLLTEAARAVVDRKVSSTRRAGGAPAEAEQSGVLPIGAASAAIDESARRRRAGER